MKSLSVVYFGCKAALTLALKGCKSHCKSLVCITGLFFLCLFTLEAQRSVIVRGKVEDIGHEPIPYATVTALDSQKKLITGATSDLDGKYQLKIPATSVFTILCTYVSKKTEESLPFHASILPDTFLYNIYLYDSEVKITNCPVITASYYYSLPVNKYATVSTRSFDAEQVSRYPGSVSDPGRMAMAFPGVQASRDNDNDIIIRGNSPTGLGWRLEGIDIANPNHFARKGSSGGGITALSLNVLGTSDFSTGAFAPEYGNAFSGIFDMRFRNGDDQGRHYTIQAGLLGLDFAAEGPFKKGESSYLANYRYSTLGILNTIGFRLVGPRVENTFQDFSFNTYFKLSAKDKMNFFGFGGISRELTSVVKDLNQRQVYDDWLRTDFKTQTGTLGLSYVHILPDNSFFRVVGVLSASKVTNADDTLSHQIADTYANVDNESYLNGRYAVAASYNKNFNSGSSLKTGFTFSNLFYSVFHDKLNIFTGTRSTLNTGDGTAQLVEPYLQYLWKISDKLNCVAGVHGMYFALNNTWSAEPRLAFKYNIDDMMYIGLAYGLHSSVLPLGTYFTTTTGQDQPNHNLDLLRAHHLVLSWEKKFKQEFRIHAELYYQKLYNLPVAADSSYYSPLNDRDGYAPVALVSKGTGENYGVDLNIDKYFSDKYFLLLAGSLYKSTYTTLRGVSYNTAYSGNYNFSMMGGRRFAFKKTNLETSTRIMYSGGLRYTPGDPALSALANDYVADANHIFTEQSPAYFRVDIRIAYHWTNQSGKAASTLSLDVQNLTNYHNYSTQIWDPRDRKLVYKPQSGMIPVISYKVKF